VLIGGLAVFSGQVYRHKNAKLAYFAQHHTQQLDVTITPLEHLCKLFANEKPETRKKWHTLLAHIN
jgi:ATPase subunit of ABC transporter with duplicated ATPase domains